MRLYLDRPFKFTPIRLIEKKNELSKLIETRDELITRELANWTLEKLLKLISKLDTEKQLIDFSKKLRRREILVLSEEYVNIDEISIQNKISFILSQVANRDIYRIFWRHFNNQPQNSMLTPLLLNLFNTENEYKDIFPKDAKRVFGEVFLTKDSFSKLASVFIRISKPIRETMNAWKLKWDSPLRRLLIDEVWAGGQSKTFLREEPTFLISEIKLMSSNQKTLFLNRYLSVLSIEEYHTPFLNWLIREYGFPIETNSYWKDIDLSNKKKVLNWLKLKQLQEFFHNSDNQRFQFWKQYLNDAEEYDTFKSLNTLVMYYKNIVIVVFGEIGNATYIYEKDVFNENFSYRVKNRMIKNVSQLKNRSINIDRIIYNGNWEQRGHSLMYRLLRR
ncbi:hypothetical protein [Fredinandcohnia sp. 179-A 10B2 NHS]|uniref:hypothetical protein n=1 Tax=Fredinandcohnia sp. 179-A 10B2 NHS TaxID=3235176 RepID=UPI0039A1B5D7